ncbi:aromatic ring-hydroxylating oxygenase subunit alpha [Pararhodobacter oceanensis]|uniref:aromatic ring-hydroxylating oxygenase subunit alpha n=1 Tax=Pararhodobacter oceanensis TaxID=2172121 RepID=UPI003A8D4AA0
MNVDVKLTAAQFMTQETRNDANQRLTDLISRHKSGFGLDGGFYTDPSIFAADLEQVFRRHWHCVGHESIIPNPGDFEQFKLGGESILLTRDRDGSVNALLNVCRHRGAKVCSEERGNRRVFVCPYHAWSYSNTGDLRSAREMPADFNRKDYGLKKLNLEVVEGLVFVSFASEPLDFQKARDVVTSAFGPHGWGDAKVAHRESYKITGNWKLAVENYVECYHCGPAHPEYSVVHSSGISPEADKLAADAMQDRARAMGIAIPEHDEWLGSDSGQEAARCFRYSLVEGAVSGTSTGAAAAPLMGSFETYDGGVTSVHIGGTSFFIGYPDYGVIYRFSPISVDETEMELVWLVKSDAVEGRDYNVEELTWLWHVTSKADKKIIELAANGVCSRYFEPGPVSPMEPYQLKYTEWYLKELSLPEVSTS